MIKVEKLHKHYGSKEVLKDINITFEKGKVYGIVGENGSGKTTLFRCIAGLEEYKGEISSDLNPLKNHLGFLETNPFFFSKITGREYIKLLCNARNKEEGELKDRNIFDLPLNQYASTYSTGMKKKLALTALLIQENDYYILDEPFNGVDIQSNIIIENVIHELRNIGKTIILSSHIFSTLSDTCDEIHLLKEGEWINKVGREDFASLEREMKKVSLGNKVEKFGLK